MGLENCHKECSHLQVRERGGREVREDPEEGEREMERKGGGRR